jgi:DNA-binding response OmpR family regulator
LVEDERTIANYVKRGLEEAGYAVDLAYTGEEALDWVTMSTFGLIILDVMLPPPDGLIVCRTLRSRGVVTPVLMLTARDAVDDPVLGLDAGADDYLVKPFAIKELLARIRALTRLLPISHILRSSKLMICSSTHAPAWYSVLVR